MWHGHTMGRQSLELEKTDEHLGPAHNTILHFCKIIYRFHMKFSEHGFLSL